MTKSDKRENIIMVASEPLTFEKGEGRIIYILSLLPHFTGDF
jgi:hypothetical protein